MEKRPDVQYTRHGKFEHPRKEMICVKCGKKKEIQAGQEKPICDDCLNDKTFARLISDGKKKHPILAAHRLE